MHAPLPDDLLNLQRRILRFVADELEPLAKGVDPERVPAELRRQVATRSERAGFYRLLVPAEEGGLGAGPLTQAAAREAFALSGNPLVQHALGAGPGLMRLADNPRQRAALYEPVLRGERRWGFGFTEPRGAERTIAAPDGDGFRVTGTKSFVSGGPDADWIVVVANVPETPDGPGGTALLVIDRDAPGVEQGAAMVTIDGSRHAPFTFRDTPVSRDRLLGEIGQGLPQAMGNIQNLRMMVSAQAVGWSRWACRSALAKIEAPHRGGEPLAEREQVQAIFADMAVETLSAQSLLYRTAAMLEQGEENPTAVAATKIVTTETLQRVVDRAMGLEGGQALMRGHPLERLYRVARALRVGEGTTEILRLTITRELRAEGPGAL